MTTWTGAGSPPSLDHVELVGALLRVYFDEAMTNNALLKAVSSYTITALDGGVSVTVLGATPGLGSPNYVDLTLNRYMTVGRLYELAVDPLLEDTAGNAMNPAGVTLQFTGVAPGSVDEPTVSEVSILDRSGDTAAGFINGLSDLWLRFFADKNQLEAFYEGTEVLFSQVYMDLLDTVLNLSLTETPLYNRKYFKMVTIREDQITYSATLARYVFNLPDSIKEFQLLCNKVYAPTAILQKATDFEIDITGTEDELRFLKDPFDWSGSGDTIPGFAVRVVETTSGAQRQISVWVPDAEIDQYNLFLNYGHLISSFSPSSEAYRALLLGISRYFILGPTLDHLLSALNVCSGFDVIRDDGEILQNVTYGLLSNTVTTDKRDYIFDKSVPLREDVENTANWGALEFDAYDTLTAVYEVKDSISDPTWWHNITVPPELTKDPATGLPESLARRSVNPYLSTPVYGDPLLKYGDPGLYYGADEDGFVPATRPPLRHGWAYLAFELFLKQNIFTVTLHPDVVSDPTFAFPVWDEQIVEIVLAGKPSYVFFHASPSTVFEDKVGTTEEELDLEVRVDLPDNLSAVDGGLAYGIRTAHYGDYYELTPTGVNILNEATDGPYDRSLGQNPLCYGGVDPTHRQLQRADDAGNTNQAILLPDYGNKQITVLLGSAAFHPDDVGRYFEDLNSGNISQITEYISDVSVKLDAWYPVNPAGSVQWYLWNDHTAGHDKSTDGGMADWPLSLTIS